MRRLERVLAAVLLALPCVAQSTSEWERVGPDLALTFPADHGVHERHRTEWWYLTGQLETVDGRRFGYQFTVFRNGLGERPPGDALSPLRARHVFAGHLALTDVAAGRTRHAERLRRGGTPLATAAADTLDVVLEDWSLVLEDDALRVRAGDAATGLALDLTLSPTKPLVLHGVRGYSRKGADPGNASAYVSWTRLATRGTVTLDGEALTVDGSSWYDHEFGSSVLEDGVEGWDWFGLQLDDDRELMLFRLRGERGAGRMAGTLVAADGTPRALEEGDFSIEETARWTSPTTGADYPAGWVLRVPSAGLELVVTPLVADAELVTTSTDVAYWEGPVALTGTTTGRGYAELTGYAGTMSGRF